MTEAMGFQIMMLLYFILANQSSDGWKPFFIIMAIVYFILSMMTNTVVQAFFKGLTGN